MNALQRWRSVRSIVSLLALLMIVALLGACGLLEQGFGSPSPTPTELPSPLPTLTFSPDYATPTLSPSPTPLATTTLPPPPTIAPLPSPTSSPAPIPTPVPRILTLWIHDDDQTIATVHTLADDFFRQEGIPLQIIPKTHQQLRIDLLATRLTDAPAPDIIWGDQDDLMDLVTDRQLGTVDWLDSDVVQAARVGATADGQRWGIPLLLSDHLLLLGNRGIIGAPPDTTNDLIAQSRGVHTAEVAGVLSAWGEPRWLLAWLNGFGGAPTTPDGQTPTLNTPEMINALNLLLELRQAAPEDQHSYEEMQTIMREGQAAFAIDGTWALMNYQQALGDQLLIAPMPVVATTGRRAAPTLTTTYLMFHHHIAEPYRSQAMIFVHWLSDPATQAHMAQQVGRFPALQSAAAQPIITNDPLLSILALQIDDATGIPPTKAMRCTIVAIQTQLPLLLQSDRNQEETAEIMQTQANECMGQ